MTITILLCLATGAIAATLYRVAYSHNRREQVLLRRYGAPDHSWPTTTRLFCAILLVEISYRLVAQVPYAPNGADFWATLSGMVTALIAAGSGVYFGIRRGRGLRPALR